MWPIRGYHIRWAFTACIAAIVGYVGWRQYYLSTPKGQIESCLDFLLTADSVELTVTQQSLFDSAVIAHEGSNANSQSQVESRQITDRATRGRIVGFIRGIAMEQRPAGSQPFEPICVLKMIKESHERDIAFSFSCGEMQVSGDVAVQRIAIRPVESSEIESIFNAGSVPSP